MTRRIERAFLMMIVFMTGVSAFQLGTLAYESAIQGAQSLGSTFAVGCFCCMICAGLALKEAWAVRPQDTRSRNDQMQKKAQHVAGLK
jgi:hypothetical protein